MSQIRDQQSFTVTYKDIDLYGSADLFVRETYIYMTKEHNLVVYARVQNRNGVIIKSNTTKTCSECNGDFIAQGADKRPLSVIANTLNSKHKETSLLEIL